MTFHTAGGKHNAFAQAAEVAPAVEKVVPSEAQRNLIANLIAEINEVDQVVAKLAVEYTMRMSMNDRWTRGREGTLSVWIDRLIGKARELRTEQVIKAASAPAAIEDGMYVLDDEIYKVIHAVHGSGRQYAKRLTMTGFEIAPGVVSQIRPEHKMTLDQAKQYGKLYGVCCNCGRTLTDEDSIAAGIGPVCAGKF